MPCDSPTVRDCYIPTADAAVRGGGLLLAILAFAGVGVIIQGLRLTDEEIPPTNSRSDSGRVW